MVTTSCHCGAVRCELAAPPETLTQCNCSICRRIGGLWAYYRPEQVKLVSEPGATLAYVWGDRFLELHTCRTCGCTTHWEPVEKEGATKMGINARMMEPAVIAGLRVRHIDGADTWEELGWSVHG
ncbi:MAG: GFA family protein [Myxococcales bacterium]|nr:GFA family protein [Myxococcales bacterium]MCB9646956.1 GFA family protein [Deltaproteobacteria bacterium]